MNHFFFHNDLDGIVSAALYAGAARSFDGCDYVLHPVASVLYGKRFEAMLNGMENVHILDYQYDPRARLWIDHHQNETIGFERVLNEKIAYDHTAKSAAHLVSDYVARFMGQQTDSAIIDAIDMIDSAGYPSVDFIFKDTSPMMILRAFLEMTVYPSEMMYCRIVEVMSRCKSVPQALEVLNIDKGYVKKLEQKAMAVRNHIEVYGKVSVVRQRHPLQNPRYSEALAVKTQYNVRITDASSTEKRIQVAYNKWHEQPNLVNIGKYLRECKMCQNGGGHFNVGGGVITNDKVDDFLDDFSLTVGED